jgi:hypothetical protein
VRRQGRAQHPATHVEAECPRVVGPGISWSRLGKGNAAQDAAVGFDGLDGKDLHERLGLVHARDRIAPGR